MNSSTLPMPDKVLQRPFEIRLLCIAFIAWSVLSLAANVPRWTSDDYVLDLGTLGFLASIGLWRLSPTGRKFALVLTWYWLIGSVLLFLQLFPLRFISVTPSTDFLAWIPRNVLRVLVIPFGLAQVWQLRILRRPDIKALFYPQEVK